MRKIFLVLFALILAASADVLLAAQAPPALTSPTPNAGTVVGTTNVTFQWSTDSQVDMYQFALGTTAPGASDIYISSRTTGASVVVPTIPNNGVTIYARLYYRISGAWQFTDYTYTESGTPAPPVLTSPTPGLSTVVGTSGVTFTWTTGSGVTSYQFALGTTAPGASDIYISSRTTGTSVVVPTIPGNGVTIYARLYYKINGAWQFADYTYTESGTPAPPVLTSPTPNTVTPLGASNVTFGWTTGTGVTSYQFALGTTAPGASDIYISSRTTGASVVVPTIPNNGVTIYARLYYKISGAWQHADYTYTESGTSAPPVLTTPTPNAGTVIGASGVTFTWTTGTGITSYQFALGTTNPGASDIYISSRTTGTSVTVPTIPSNGVTIFARLYYKISGAWQFTDYTYTESGTSAPPVLNSPTPNVGAVVGTSDASFGWSTGAGVTYYQFALGTTGAGASNIYISNWTTDTSVIVPAIPSNGVTIYARLYYRINGAWQHSDYTYTESGSVLTLSPTSSGNAIENAPYGENVTVSGGTGTGYSFKVNGTGVPNNGSTTALSNGLSVSSTGNGKLKISGTPTSLATVSFTVSATDSGSNSVGPIDYSVNVSGGPNGANNSYLSGQYVCEVGGYVDSGATLWSSLMSFNTDGNGNITSGVFDSNGNNPTYYPSAVNGTLTGTFNIGSDNNGTVTLTTSTSVLGTTTSQWAIAANNFSSGPASEFRMVETDDVGSSPSGHSGSADCYQASTSNFTAGAISGNGFVFEMTGTTSSGGAKSQLGRLSAASGSVTTGVIDQARAFSTPTYTNVTLTGGSYTTPDSNTGRFTLTLTDSDGSLNYAVYIVDNVGMFMLETDSGNGTQVGRMFTQQQPEYSLANVAGPSVSYDTGVLYGSGCSLSGYASQVFQGTADTSGDFTINEEYDDLNGIFESAQDAPFTFTADQSNAGRFVAPYGNNNVYLYLYNNDAGVFMDVKNTGTGCSDGSGYVLTGYVEPQAATTFLSGNFMLGQFVPFSSTAPIGVGQMNIGFDGTATANITNGGEGDFNWDLATSGLTWSSDSQTTGTLTLEIPENDYAACAVINATRMACIPNSSSVSPTVFLLQQ